MPLKNLLVHLDQSEQCPARLALAVELAARHGARLGGLFAQRARAHVVGVVASWPSQAYREAAEASRRAFEQAAAGLGAGLGANGAAEWAAEWADANRGSEAEVVEAVAAHARTFDLAVLSQDDGSGRAAAPEHLAEEVVLQSGRPCLVLPYAGRVASVGQRPLIAWNNSREAARAVNDALPLIAGCDEAVVVTFSRHCDADRDAAAGLIRHLAAHGVAARAECLFADEVGVMDMLLNRGFDLGADLLVMGAHAHQGLPALARASGTRHILKHMTMPVLMSA